LTQVSTAKIFSGVTIPEVWEGGGQVYAIACLDRAKAAAALRETIGTKDGEAGKYIEKAMAADKAGKVRELSKALGTIVEREVLNGELRIVDYDGVGVPSVYSHIDVSAAFEAAVEALKVGVFAEGPYDGDFRTAIIEGLSKRGFKVTDGEADGMDVLIKAVIRIEDGGKGSGPAASLHFARGVIQVEVKNASTSKVLGAFNESRKEGHRNLEEAERKAVRELAKKLVGQVGDKINTAMMR
jgi:hypothetical protein